MKLWGQKIVLFNCSTTALTPRQLAMHRTPLPADPMHGLKKGGMRRLAEDGATAHELMAISGHKTLTEVQRYTAAADYKRLADSAMAKRTKRVADVTNSSTPVHKLARKPA